MVCGPLERLSLGGVLCGCLESQDQFYYRLAYLTLQSQQVRWFRRLGQYNLQNANATSSKTDNDGADNNARPSSAGSSPQDLASLKAEKGQLHQMLRSYEKDFFKLHNRQVSSFADIRPVASQYRRYKEIKKAISAAQQGGGEK